MSRLRQAWESWLALLRHREPGTGLALLRIVVGCALLWELVGPLLTDTVELLWMTAADGGYRPAKGPGGWRWRPFGGYSPAAVHALGLRAEGHLLAVHAHRSKDGHAAWFGSLRSGNSRSTEQPCH